MKITDFRPEHFEKGRNFKKSDFNAYLEAAEQLNKTMYTRYLPCVGAGLLLGLVFSKGAGGFIGNILALICTFGGLIIGGIFNAKAARRVNEQAKGLGITRADHALARKHVKNGTLAWSGGSEATAEQEIGSLAAEPAGEEKSAAQSAVAYQAGDEKSAEFSALFAKEERAIWAALLLTAGCALLLLFQLSFARNFAFVPSSFYCLAAAVLASAVYLLSRKQLRWRLAGGGFALLAVLLLALFTFLQNQYMQVVLKGPAYLLRIFREPLFNSIFHRFFVNVLLSLIVMQALSFWLKTYDKRQTRLRALLAAAAFLILQVWPWFKLWRIGKLPKGRQFFMELISSNILPALVTAICIYLVCMTVYSLCRMSQSRVKLSGLAKFWCWLALLGSVVVLFITLRAAFLVQRFPEGKLSAAFLILGLSALLGYLLLLLKRRIGLYFILLGMGLILVSQLAQALAVLAQSGNTRLSWSLLLPAVLGGLNPLFAFLAVRAGSAADPEQDSARAPLTGPVRENAETVTERE